MDWIRSFQKAIDYIEDHLTDSLDYSRIAQEVNISVFYFQKIFSILCGISLGEYIRSRRLTLAGIELISTDERILDIAMKYGYDTPEGFTRAFTRFHGITPIAARNSSAGLKSFAKLSISITMKGGSIMDYRILKKDSFKVLEKVEKHSINDSQNLNTIPEFWMRAHTDGTVRTLLEQTPDKEFIFGICYGNIPKDVKTFDYGIAALYGGGKIPEGFRIKEIPARTWAVFVCKGPLPNAIQETWHKICTEFFPTSGYQPTYEMDIEAYTNTNNMPAEDYYSEIWVTVEKK